MHAEMRQLLEVGDRRRMEVLKRQEVIPTTATWGLQSATAFAFDDPCSVFCAAPTRTPTRHLAGTPDRVDADALLPTSHAALCAMEELGRVNMLNSNLLLHVLDEAEVSAQTGGPTDLPSLFARLRSAAGRLAGGAVDIHQTATYHRRWSLLQGADVDVMRRMLQSETGVGITAIFDATAPMEAVTWKEAAEQVKTEDEPAEEAAEEEAVEAADEVAEDTNMDDGITTTTGKGGPSTPKKLTISDVESVLGVLKSAANTPQSTSSLSSIVNRISGQVANDFLMEFQNLGGEEAPLTTLGSLNIS